MSGRFSRLGNTLIDVLADTKLSEMVLPEEQVLERLNAVSTAKRLANMVRSVFNLLHGPAHGRAYPTFGYRRPVIGVTPLRATQIASSASLLEEADTFG